MIMAAGRLDELPTIVFRNLQKLTKVPLRHCTPTPSSAWAVFIYVSVYPAKVAPSSDLGDGFGSKFSDL